MNDDIKKLREEVEYYRSLYETASNIINLQHDSINKMHEVFMLQEAELNKLRGENK